MLRTLPARLLRSPWHPECFAVGAVVGFLADSNEPTHGAMRALSVALALAIVLHLVAALALRSWWRGAVGASVAVLLLIGSVGSILVALALLGGAAIHMARQMHGHRVRPLTPLLNVLGAGWLLGGVTMALHSGAIVLPDVVSSPEPAQANSAVAGPDIYLILLDAYPRADTLAGLGIDNEPFLAALAERGFDVNPESHSNYPLSALTLVSMLNMTYAHELDWEPAPSTSDQQVRLITRHIADAKVIRELRGNGYRIASTSSGFTTYYLDADVRLDSGEITFFEGALIRQTWGGRTLALLRPEWLAEQHRARIRGGFDGLEILSAEPSPKLVFAHVLAPHTPLVFRTDGSPQPLPACFPRHCGFWDGWAEAQLGMTRDQFGERLGEQIAWVNARTLAAIDHIQQASAAPPVIIVMSDHGMRLDPDDGDEYYRTLFAAATPDRPGLLADTSPVNVFGRLSSAYFGTAHPSWPNLICGRGHHSGPPLTLAEAGACRPASWRR